MSLKPTIAALRALAKALGIRKTASLSARLALRQARGEPFASLPPADGDDERMSREQIGPAIVLFDELRRRLGEEEALRVTRDVVIAATLAFLSETIGPLRRSDLEPLSQPDREAFVRALTGRFFNATVQMDGVSADEVRFTVTACRFPSLCEEAGVPELAPVFCRGDEVYFGETQPDVALDRGRTLAEGGDACVFRLSWTE